MRDLVPREAPITIVDTPLTSAQSMTIRVAIEHFAQSLADDGLGDDDHGQAMVALYLARIREIRQVLYGPGGAA